MLRVAIYNVRGLRNRKKRIKVFKMVEIKGFDVVFLQETHCANINEGKYWGSNFTGKCFWSFGSNFSCGVGILLKHSLPYKVINIDFDFKGRFLGFRKLLQYHK